jgi:single-strand DNA-binding protein
MAKIQIIGNVGRDPEQRYTPSGTMVVTFTVAVNNRRRNPDGSFQEETEWFRVSTFGRLAEVCQQYVAKGNQIYVEGRLRVDRWTGQDGQPRTTLDVLANDVQFIGARVRDEDLDRAGGEGLDRPAAQPAQRPAAARGAPTELDQSDLEDLPF